MLSVPAIIPATIVATFPAGFAPLSVGRLTRSATGVPRPGRRVARPAAQHCLEQWCTPTR